MSELRTTWQLLRNKYPENECVLIEEVSDTTGGRNRSADFIVINLWPSRGNSIIGFERKSYRSDWLSELKNPAKQEAHFKFCDRFYLITDKENIAKLDEIPETWGWIHSDGKRLKTMKEAPKLTPVPCTRAFICSMLRRAASKEKYVHVDSIQDRVDAEVERSLTQQKYEQDYKVSDYDRLKMKVDAFEKESGIKLENGWRQGAEETGKAVKMVLGWDNSHEIQLQRLQKMAEGILTSINNQLTEAKFISECQSKS